MERERAKISKEAVNRQERSQNGDFRPTSRILTVHSAISEVFEINFFGILSRSLLLLLLPLPTHHSPTYSASIRECLLLLTEPTELATELRSLVLLSL